MTIYPDRIAVGSGDVYCSVFHGSIPGDSTIETESNRLGYIEGGASLEYKPKFSEAMDDSGKRSKEVLTNEEATFKLGLITWNADALLKVTSTARVTRSGNKRQLKIGGKGNDDGKKYIIRFVHRDAVDGNCRITIVGKNTAGWSLAFDPEKPTKVEPEIKAMPHDSDGTLIIYDEEIIGPTIDVTSAAGDTSGKTAITVTPSIASGNTYVYKTAASVTEPDIGDTLTSWTAWNGSDEITATTNDVIVIAEIDGSSVCMEYGIATVVSNATI